VDLIRDSEELPSTETLGGFGTIFGFQTYAKVLTVKSLIDYVFSNVVGE
jgi:hypothetical protein